MTKDRAARLATVLVLAGLLAFAVVRRTIGRFQPAPPPTPQDAIYAMLDAARAGDSAAYLAQYTGQMEANLRQALSERTAAGFETYLKSSNAEIKGVAVSEPKILSDREVEVRVEYVYQDRNETQTMFLE